MNVKTLSKLYSYDRIELKNKDPAQLPKFFD
jgi:hypothetical protein